MKNHQQSISIASFVLENLRDAVIVVDAANRITNINNTAKRWFNGRENVTGLSVFELLPESRLFKNKWDIPNEIIKFQILKDGQTVWYEASITPLAEGEKEPSGRVVVVHDITQEKSL